VREGGGREREREGERGRKRGRERKRDRGWRKKERGGKGHQRRGSRDATCSAPRYCALLDATTLSVRALHTPYTPQELREKLEYDITNNAGQTDAALHLCGLLAHRGGWARRTDARARLRVKVDARRFYYLLYKF